MYPQEKRHKYNTLSFLNNRFDSKRFSLSSPHPNPLLCCRPWAGLGNRTRQSEGRVSAHGGQNFQDRRRLDENDRGLSHYLNQSWEDRISPLKGPQLSTPTSFPPTTRPITKPPSRWPGSPKSSLSNQKTL